MLLSHTVLSDSKDSFQELHHFLMLFGGSFIYTVKAPEPIVFKPKLPK